MADIKHILKEYWGYDQFRPLQEEIINTVLGGGDCLALLPTGGGKSLCFQVPAMAINGLCLVISPLIALMKDQVSNLRRKNITAFSIHSGMTRMEVKQTLATAGTSNCKFLYVSPERLETNLFKEYLPGLNVRLIAVDEAHCISQWGYDFRPSYLRIAELRAELPGIPVLALTASATAEVQMDICEKLLFTGKTIFRQSFERPNLSYSVFRVASKINRITEILQKVQGTGIVYCKSRRRTREISDLLKINGVKADYYHAGLSQEERNRKQEAWIQNEIRVIVCTNAFGMGIDKPDVRIVIHADSPDCLENYYQEAGRAGRDGKRCYAVLLYTEKDLLDLEMGLELRFPGIEKMRIVYESLMNYLQVPVGSGQGNSFEFDLPGFTKNFKLEMNEVLASFQTFEQEELIEFNEQVFIPSKIHVIAARERLFELEQKNIEADEVLKTLLRTYPGIRDQETFIYEKQIAYTVKIAPERLIEVLNLLHRNAFIKYSPIKDKPQVFLLSNRVKTQDLRIDQERLARRKKLYRLRIDEMIKFVQARTQCRSRIIGNYFGDPEMKNCGICDNCLAQKKKTLSAEEFREIEKRIVHIIHQSPSTIPQITALLAGIEKNKTREVIRFLQAEERVVVDDNGFLKNNR